MAEELGGALVKTAPLVSDALRLDQLDAIILALLRWRSGR
jgi:hypothetical protein